MTDDPPHPVRLREASLRGLGLVLALAMVAALFVLGAGPGAVGLVLPPWDKVLHAAFFAALAALLWVGLGARPLLVVCLASLVGLADELHQARLPGRSADPLDWLADTVAAGLIVTLLHLAKRNSPCAAS